MIDLHLAPAVAAGGAVCAYKALRMAHKLHQARSTAELKAAQQQAEGS